MCEFDGVCRHTGSTGDSETGTSAASDATTGDDGGSTGDDGSGTVTSDTGSSSEETTDDGGCRDGFDGCSCAFETTCFQAGQICVGGFCEDGGGTTGETSGGDTTSTSTTGNCFDDLSACETEALSASASCSAGCDGTTTCEIEVCYKQCEVIFWQAEVACYDDASSCTPTPPRIPCTVTAYQTALSCWQSCPLGNNCNSDLGGDLSVCNSMG